MAITFISKLATFGLNKWYGMVMCLLREDVFDIIAHLRYAELSL